MKHCKILIIDDDRDDVQILANAFTDCGVESVNHVPSAMKAFMYLEEREPQDLPRLIITDLYLPGISGEEFLKDLKGMDKYKHIPVVVLSSIKTEDEREAYRQMGAINYFLKPSTYDEYLQIASDIKRRLAIAE